MYRTDFHNVQLDGEGDTKQAVTAACEPGADDLEVETLMKIKLLTSGGIRAPSLTVLPSTVMW